MKIKNYIFIIFLLLSACFSTTPTLTSSTGNVADIYNPGSTTIHPKYEIYHENDSVSLLYIYLYTPELGFINFGNSKKQQAKIKISYKIMESFQNSYLIDTATKMINIKRDKNKLSFVTYIRLKPNKLDNYVLQIFIKDMNKERSNLEFIYVDKKDENSPQNYLITYPNDFNPIFNDYINSKEKYLIKYNKTIDSLYITKYNLDTNLSPPPFSTRAYKPVFEKDTLFKIKFSDNSNFDYSKQGIYFIQTDKTQKKGKAIINFGDEYPLIQSSTKMFEPLKYLTTSEEFAEMQKQPNKKIVVDNFWLSTTDNLNLAKEMIRIYYSRVFYSNLLFSSYQEGWKSDRGMAYIIFGPPQYLYIGDNYEKWVYQDNKADYFRLVFRKKEHQFSENNYVLERDQKFKKYWTEAVEYWREGKIY